MTDGRDTIASTDIDGSAFAKAGESRHGSTKALTYENRLLAALTLTFGVVFLDRSALTNLAPFVARELHLSKTQIGILASGLALTWAIFGILVGRVSDRIGRQRSILTAAILVFSLSSIVSGVAGGFAALLAARMLMGVSEGPVLPISQTLMAQSSAPRRRGLNMGVMQQFGSNVLGAFVAPILLVAIARRFGWRDAFFLAGALGPICALLVWRVVRSPAAAESGPARVAFPVRDALRYRNIPLCMALAALMVSQASLAFVFLPFLFLEVTHLSATTMSVLMSVLGISAVVFSIVTPALSDRFGRKPVIMAVCALSFLVPVGVWLSGSSLIGLGLSLFFGFAASGAAPLVMATIPTETLPSPNVAAVVGLIVGVAEIFAAFAGPLLGGLVADRYGLSATLVLQAILVVVLVGLACLLVETAPSRSQGAG